MDQNRALTPMENMKKTIQLPSVQEQFNNALAENASLFVASLIDIYGSDTYLQKCQPSAVIREALKAATLKLPINKQLGFAWIVPYKQSAKDTNGQWSKVSVPQFQIGWRGLVQLAIRSGQYRYINADYIYAGETVSRNRITGGVVIEGMRTSDEVIGYFAYLETVSGFRKCLCWTKEEMLRHAKRFSKSYEQQGSAWQSDFDAMGLKTMLRALLGKYGILSVELVRAMSEDPDTKAEAEAQSEIDAFANTEVIDTTAIDAKPANGGPATLAPPDANAQTEVAERRPDF